MCRVQYVDGSDAIRRNRIVILFEPTEPYKAYHADQFTCPGCGIEIVADFAEQPMWNHYDDEDVPEGVDVIAVHERPQADTSDM